MRHAFILFALLAISACTGDGATNGLEGESPLPPGPGPLAVISGLIVKNDGTCIDSASVRVIQGQGLDRSAAQRTPCDVSAGEGGFVLTDLTPGLTMTIRASGPGYESRDTIVTPTLGPQSAVLLTLRKMPDASPRSR